MQVFYAEGMKAQIMSLLFLLLGAFGGYKMAIKPSIDMESNKTTQQSGEYKIKYEELKIKFQSLSDNEIENYLNENDLALKTEKADLMLTKLLKLFLVDVGLRLDAQNSKLLNSQKAIKKYPIGNNSQNKIVATAKCNYTKLTCEKKYGEFKEIKEEMNWKKKELKLSGAISDKKITTYLESIKVDNFFDYLKGSYKSNYNLYTRLIGFYKGDVVFDDPRQSVLQMEFDLKNDLVYKKPDILGTFRIQLFRDGKNVSNSTGDGNLNFLKEYNKKSKGFIISTGRLYFHMYFAPSRRFMFGNVYEKKSVSSYTKVAKVILSRQ